MTPPAINPAYAMPDQRSQKWPALQASTYTGFSDGQEIPLAIGEASMSMLATPEHFESGEIVLKNGSREDALIVPDKCRWVVVGIPQVMVYDKAANSVRRIRKGDKLGNGLKSVTRLLMACQFPNGYLVVDDQGLIQLFTLKLSSTNTNLVNGDSRNPDFKCLEKAKESLSKHWKVPGSVLHLVSLEIKAIGRIKSSSTNKESSLALSYELAGSARPLTETWQRSMFDLVQSQEVQDFLANPFGDFTGNEITD